jgi:cysteinyl-tRNA synthetase
MATKHLGEQIDIHGGGQDLVFPHHENEIAQSEAYSGKEPFARYWLHNGLMQLSGEKMSKSLGNLVPVKEVLKAYNADTIRLFVLSSHYRSPLTYSEDGLAAAQRGVKRMISAVEDFSPAILPVSHTLELEATTAREKFDEAMDDDFNTAAALASMFQLVTEINRARDQGATAAQRAIAQRTLLELAEVLGLSLKQASQEELAYPIFVDLLVEIRDELRATKHYNLSDKIRSRIRELGINLEDTLDGTRWRRLG